MKHNNKAEQTHPKTLGGLVDAAYREAFRRFKDPDMAVMIATVVANEAILNGLRDQRRTLAA